MKKIKILIPAYNDWQSLSKLLNNIDNEIKNIDHEISIIIVDDASNFDRQLDLNNLSNIFLKNFCIYLINYNVKLMP